MQKSRMAAGLAALALCLPLQATAQDAAQEAAPPETTIQLELNGAVPTETGGCRLTMVTTNMMEQGLARAAWQVAIFDAAGVVQALPILDFGALTAGKTKVAMFELPGRGCDDLGRIVINDVAECRGDNDTDLRDACLGGLATQTRTSIEFGL